MIETSRNEEILRGLGINPDTNYKTQVWITEQDRSTAKKILDDLQVERPIVVCPFGQYEIRNWPINKWARLLDNYRDNPIVICGIAENKRKAEQIISLTGHSNIHNLCGQTTLRELAALLERAAACVCVESAAGHIAAAVGCPQTVITGGGHFGRFLPYSPTTTMVYMPMDCFNCNWICTFQEKEVYCISQIKVETVDRAVRKVMQTSRQSFTRPELIEQKTEFLRPAEPKQDSSKYLITAIVSTYNSEKHIAGCLEDLESQTIADKVEIIVVDSSSRQNERAIVQEFQKRYSNIKYIRTENRETVYKAWNRAIAAATGKYITNANTDDRHRKDALEVMADTLDKNPDIAVVYSDQQWVDDKGAVVNEFAAPEHSRWILLFDKCYVSSNPMWRKTIHQSCGLFDEDLFFVSGDREFWLRVSQKYNFLHIPQMLGIRRFTPDCISRINVEQRDGCDHLEASLITKCYHHALETGQQIDNKGISGNPMFNSWPEVKLLREKLKAKLQDKKINPADYISQTIDCRKSQTHKLSIVIDSFNQKDSLINNLSNLNNQSEKDFEVIVVNRGDELAELRQTCDIKYDLCCVNLKENLGSSFGRNIGISMAKAEYVAFLDQDSVAHPDFVKNIYEGFKKYEIYGLRGKILPLNSKFSALCPDYYDIGDQVIYTACETVTNCAFRKDVLTRVGGFDEDLFAYQAQELSYKIYMLEGEKVDRISYLPEIIVYHDYIKDIADWSQKALDNKAGKMAATRKWLWQKYNLGLDSYLELMRSNYPASRNKQTADFKKLLNIAIILQENNPELAVQWAQKAIAANPSVGKGYYLLGSLYFNLARYAEAEAMLEKTLDLLVPAIIAKPAMRSERELEVYQGSQSCYLSACTKLAHCYMLSGDLKKLKGIYTHMLTNHHLEMPGELRSQIKGLLDKLKENESVTANKISTSSSGQLFNEPQKIQNRQELNVSPNPAESKYTVSAIVSVYNCRKFIRRCLEDLENQTIADKLEIIVVNSGSQENEEQIVKEFQQKYNNIKYIKTEHREGIYRAWNRAVAAARGRYLTSANTDDRHRKDALEIMAKALDAEPDVALVYGDQIYTDTPNPTFENHHVVEMNRRPEFSRQSLLFECYIGSQPMWRKSLHDELGGFDETLIRASDWDFWLRIAGKYKLKHIPEFLGLFYLNENAVGFRRTIHRLYERYLVGRRYGNPYISAIPLYGARGNPLVSIVMAAYNAADYIARAIESVLIQNYRNFELIIVDDGSTDQTADVVRSFKDEPIKYFFKEYGGSASARNFALKKSSGSFIVMLDSNDMMTPDFISRHLQEFEKKPEADLIYCDDCLIDENDKPIRVINRPEYKDRNLLIRDLFRSGFPVVPFRTCIRKEVFEKIGLYDEQLIIAEDYDMIRRFIKQGLKLGHLPTALYLRRLTAEGLSKSFSERKARSHFEVVRRITETFNYDELFPNVKWEKVAPEKRHLHFRCLVAMTYLAIGQSYIQSNSPLYAQSAIDMAQMEIKQCLKDDPANQRLQQLLYKCQQYQAELAEKKRQMVCQPA
jgi:glycosyltransferase involved in cell wall biosynthesis